MLCKVSNTYLELLSHTILRQIWKNVEVIKKTDNHLVGFFGTPFTRVYIFISLFHTYSLKGLFIYSAWKSMEPSPVVYFKGFTFFRSLWHLSISWCNGAVPNYGRRYREKKCLK